MQAPVVAQPNYSRIKLCKESEEIIKNSPTFNNLKIPINSTIGYSHNYKEFRVTRLEHSIHSSKQAHTLKMCKLSAAELKCLELSLLLHDLGHTPGSHSIDKLYVKLHDSPDISKLGYSKSDYHEYHTVELVNTEEFKRLFATDPGAYANVLATLSIDDPRPFRLKFPEVRVRPTLTDTKIKMIAELKDWLDRVSYIELEYAQLNPDRRSELYNTLNAFKSKIELFAEHIPVFPSEETHKLLDYRSELFSSLVYNPLAGAYDQYIKRNIQKEHLQYEVIKNKLKSGDRKIFTPELNEVLDLRTKTCLSESLVPLITLDDYLLTPLGIAAFSEYDAHYYPNLAEHILNRPTPTSIAELLINEKVNKEKQHNIYVITTPRELKTFRFHTKCNGQYAYVEREEQQTGTPGVVIALENVTSTEEINHLRKQIGSLLKKNRYIKSELDLDFTYNRDILKRT